MLSARSAWKHRKLLWKCRGLWKYRGLWVHRKDLLAGVIAGGAVAWALAQHCLGESPLSSGEMLRT